MVGSMNDDNATRRLNRRGLLATTGGALLGLQCALALAADLPDPTRPPMAQRHAPASGVAPTERPTAPILQSTLTGAGRKPSVIINGRAIELGESFDDMRLMSVTETGAVLSGPRGSTTLALTPAADKLAAGLPGATRVATAPTSARRPPAAALTIRLPEEK